MLAPLPCAISLLCAHTTLPSCAPQETHASSRADWRRRSRRWLLIQKYPALRRPCFHLRHVVREFRRILVGGRIRLRHYITVWQRDIDRAEKVKLEPCVPLLGRVFPSAFPDELIGHARDDGEIAADRKSTRLNSSHITS